MALPPLVQRVAVVADDALDRLNPGPIRDRVVRLRGRLEEPLRIAVAGREKAGKSTFVNAILGEDIAPTDAGVCTRVVTWYRYEQGQGVEITKRTGESRHFPLRRDDGGLGQAIIELDADPSEIERVTIYLPNRVLQDLTIIDTPGLASMSEQLSGATHELLFLDNASRAASEKADALVFMLSPTVMADDRQALVDFTDRFGGLSGSAGNAMAILGRADQLGDGQNDPWAVAEQMAARQADVLAGLVSTVTPLVGLLAESASHFRATDMEHLISLAAMDRSTREMILLDTRFLLDLELPVPLAARRRLVDMLGRYGLERVLTAIDSGLVSPRRMVSFLRDLSGIERVEGILAHTFRERSDALRARAALFELNAIAWDPDPDNRSVLHDLRVAVERLELDPAMHRLAEIGAGQQAAAYLDELPSQLRADLHLLLSETEPMARLGNPIDASRENLMRIAAEGERRWHAVVNDPGSSFRVRRIARVFNRSHALLYEALAGSGNGSH